MNLVRLTIRCVLPLAVFGRLSNSSAKPAENYPPDLIAFLDKNAPDEVWLARLEKLSAGIIAQATNDEALKDEYARFMRNDTLLRLVIDEHGDPVVQPDDGSMNAFSNAKFPRTGQMLKGIGSSPYEYYAAHAVMEVYGHLMEQDPNSIPLRDNKRIRAGVAFFKQNLERLEQVGRVIR